MTLGEIFNKHKTDKYLKHRYDKVYEKIIDPSKPCNFLEIGVFRGESLAAWKEYLHPDSKIYGLDIFIRTHPEDLPILKQKNVFWAKGDTLDPGIATAVSKFGVEFDYILDDGAHWPEANKLTFRHLHKFLAPGGLYIIEDVWPLDIMTNEQLKHSWLLKYPERYSHLENEMFIKELDAADMPIECWDNRKTTGEPDSYIITLRKE